MAAEQVVSVYLRRFLITNLSHKNDFFISKVYRTFIKAFVIRQFGLFETAPDSIKIDRYVCGRANFSQWSVAEGCFGPVSLVLNQHVICFSCLLTSAHVSIAPRRCTQGAEPHFCVSKVC